MTFGIVLKVISVLKAALHQNNVQSELTITSLTSATSQIASLVCQGSIAPLLA